MGFGESGVLASKPLGTFDIEVIPLSDSLWKARVLFPSHEITERQMVMGMRQAKQCIAVQFTVPAEILEFREVLGKERTPEGLLANLLIGRLEVGRGKTVVRFKALHSPSDERFEDMIAEVDFYYLDEFDQIIDRDRLGAALERWGVTKELIKPNVIDAALQKVLAHRSLVTDLEIAQGRFPDRGSDAELEYTFLCDPSAAANLGEYQSSRKVVAGDILCQKTPAKEGRAGGMTVRKASLPPLKGLDFQLVAGEGAKLSRDGLRMTAARDGLAVMHRKEKKIYTPFGMRTVPYRIEIEVRDLVTIEGDRIINLNSESSVEIRGVLKEGSLVSSQGEIILIGDVETGAQVTAKSDIVIQGRVKGAQISSEASVHGDERVENSTVEAEKQIDFSSTVENSDLTADCISVLESLGCRLNARKKLILDKACSGPDGRKTLIRIGRNDFYAKKLAGEMEEIDTLSTSLEKLRDFFGDGLVDDFSQENMQRLIIRELKRLRHAGHKHLGPKHIESLKALLAAIAPLRGVLSEKSEEIKVLLQKVNEEESSKPLIVIKEKIGDPVEVTIGEASATITPSETGVVLTTTETGEITTQPLPVNASSDPDLT